MANELQIDHEVRMLENIAQEIDKRFDRLESKMDTQFHWVIGTILAFIATTLTLFGGIILHIAKLV